jgi:hypothetical protein
LWHTLLIPALGRLRQVDLSEFEVRLVYRVSYRTARATQRNPVSKKIKEPNWPQITFFFFLIHLSGKIIGIPYHTQQSNVPEMHLKTSVVH